MPVLHNLDELGRVGLHVVQRVEADHERRPCQRLDIVQIDRLGTLCQVSLAGCPCTALALSCRPPVCSALQPCVGATLGHS